jgi:hypothetical protein
MDTPARRDAEGEDAEDEAVDAAPARVNAALPPPSKLRELRGLRVLTRIGATFTSAAAAATDITRTRGYRKWKTNRVGLEDVPQCESPNLLTSDLLTAR